jgi:hypothetical protein
VVFLPLQGPNVLPDGATPAIALVCAMFIVGWRLVLDHSLKSAVYLTGPRRCLKTLLSTSVIQSIAQSFGLLLHCVLLHQWLFFLDIFANSLLRSIRLDHRGVVGTGSLFNLLDVRPHFMSLLAAIEYVGSSYSNRVSCSLQIFGRSSISIP